MTASLKSSLINYVVNGFWKADTAVARVATGAGANLLSQAVSTVIVLTAVPLMLSSLGVEEYGRWVLISSIPAYLAMSDLGIGIAAGNLMTAAKAAKDTKSASRLFERLATLISLIAIAVVLLGACVGISYMICATDPRRTSVAATVVILSALSALNLYTNLSEAAYKSSAMYARGVNRSTFARLCEFVIGVAALGLTSTMVGFAAGSLLGRLFATAILLRGVQRDLPEYEIRIAKATWQETAALLKPGLSFLSFPVATAVTLQGTNIIVGSIAGAAALATFVSFRTLSRTLIQAAAIVNKAIWPEITRLHISGNSYGLRRLYRIGIALSSLCSLAAALLLFCLGPRIVDAWTASKITFDPIIFGVLVLGAAVAAYSQFSYVLICGLNRPEGYSKWNVGIAVTAAPLIFAGTKCWGLTGASALTLVSEIASAACLYVLARKMLKQ